MLVVGGDKVRLVFSDPESNVQESHFRDASLAPRHGGAEYDD